MNEYFARIARDFLAICKGLAVTFKYLFLPAITVRYPDEKLLPFERFRGALLFDAETCIACNLCVKACPSDCIALENAVNETGKKIAKVNWYTIDFGKCNFCRLCEEACPTKPKSVWHALDYELTFFNRHEMVRSWRKGNDFIGTWFDPKTNAWRKPEGQISLVPEPARR